MFKKGFTIIEIIIAIFLIATSLTAVISGLTTAIGLQNYNQDLNQAVILTINELEQKNYHSLSLPTKNIGLFQQSTAVSLVGQAKQVCVTTAWDQGQYAISRWFYPE